MNNYDVTGSIVLTYDIKKDTEKKNVSETFHWVIYPCTGK